MKEYKIKWSGKEVTVKLHSELDDVLSLLLESLIERSLIFNDGMDGTDPFSLSKYNKGEFLFLVEKLKDGFKVDFCIEKDLANLEPELLARFEKQMGFDAVFENIGKFPVSMRKMPWGS